MRWLPLFLLLVAGPTSAADDPLARALSLFSAQELATMPRIVVARTKPERAAADAEGYVVPGYPVIYIAAWSDTYRAAVAGDSRAFVKLAGIIAHERVHVEQGAAERPAYAAEMLMLRRCAAPPAMIDGVRRAMRASTR
jgi:hypothetical protein